MELNSNHDPAKIELYRQWAKGRDLFRLSGRKIKAQTDFINSIVAEKLSPKPEHRVADIGCGDGSLIACLSSECIGTVASHEECARLRSEYGNLKRLRFEVGLAHQLPVETGWADRVVCNGVLILLPSVAAMEIAVAELARITASGGKLWIGEVRSVNPEASPKFFGSQRLGRLVYKIKSFDREYIKYANLQFHHMRKHKPPVVDRGLMIALAEKNALKLMWDGPHLYSGGKKPLLCPVRRNYLFRKLPEPR